MPRGSWGVHMRAPVCTCPLVALGLLESGFRVDAQFSVIAASRCSRRCSCCCGCLLLLLLPLASAAPHSISLPWAWLCPCVCQESLHADLVAASGLIAGLQRDRVSAGMCHDVCQQGIEVGSGHRAQQETCASGLVLSVKCVVLLL